MDQKSDELDAKAVSTTTTGEPKVTRCRRILRRVMLWHALGRPLQTAPGEKVKFPRLRRWTFAVASRLALVPLLALPLWLAFLYALTHPTRQAPSVSPQRYHLTSRDVRFSTNDGVELEGWYINSATATDLVADGAWTRLRPGVVLCHNYGAARDQLLSPLAIDLVGAGYDVLLFDFRGHGTSADAPVSLGPIEAADVIAAVECLRGQPGVDRDRIGVLGLGMGGYAAILAAGRSDGIRCVVAVDAYPSVSTTLRRRMDRAWMPRAAGTALSWGLGMYFGQNRMGASAVEVAGSYDQQGLLLVCGSGNHRAPFADLDGILRVGNSKTARLIVPGASKGQTIFSPVTGQMALRYFDSMLTDHQTDAEVSLQGGESAELGKIEIARSSETQQ